MENPDDNMSPGSDGFTGDNTQKRQDNSSDGEVTVVLLYKSLITKQEKWIKGG